MNDREGGEVPERQRRQERPHEAEHTTQPLAWSAWHPVRWSLNLPTAAGHSFSMRFDADVATERREHSQRAARPPHAPRPGHRGPHRGHIRATNDQIAADNHGHHRSGICPGQRQNRPDLAGRHHRLALPDTEEVTGSNPVAPTRHNVSIGPTLRAACQQIASRSLLVTVVRLRLILDIAASADAEQRFG
jgi:hypothetical protein